jgi:thioredoxin 1
MDSNKEIGLVSDLVAVSDADFEQQVLKSPKPVLVDFWAAWCQPCLMLGPIVEQVAKEKADSLSVVKLDVDANQRTAMTYGVQSIPTLVLFMEGKEVKRLVGYMPKQKLADEVQRAIGETATA